MSQLYKKDSEWYAAAEPVFNSDVAHSFIPGPPAHDVLSRRENAAKMYSLLFPPVPLSVPVEVRRHEITSFDGAAIGVYEFRPQTVLSASEKDRKQEGPSPAVIYAHGGGMISLDAATVHNQTASMAADSGVPFFSVDYRLAPESPHPAPTQDVFHALMWLHREASAATTTTTNLNIDPARIAVAGESAGGGIAAGVALLARDRKIDPPLAKQILWYPMLDHRTAATTSAADASASVVDPALLPHLTWSPLDNITGWSALLGRDVATESVEDIVGLQYASPARAATLDGLPATYLDVGDLDLFHNEIVDYARRLRAENSTKPLELHVFPGIPHGFNGIARDTSIVKRALALRNAAVQALWDC